MSACRRWSPTPAPAARQGEGHRAHYRQGRSPTAPIPGGRHLVRGVVGCRQRTEGPHQPRIARRECCRCRCGARLFAGVTGSDVSSSRRRPERRSVHCRATSPAHCRASCRTSTRTSRRSSRSTRRSCRTSPPRSAQIFGTNVFSLNQNEVFGASNFGDHQRLVLDDVASLGESPSRRGTRLDQVRSDPVGYVDDSAHHPEPGFNRDQLDQPVASPGLSGPALDEFIRQVKDPCCRSARARRRRARRPPQRQHDRTPDAACR